jgi:predicted ABC-type ATPase
MQQPYLRIFAGCNGSGKSTYSQVFSQDTLPFDFDKRFLECYNSMLDSELREEIAKNRITEAFLNESNNAILNNESFAFETNLYPYPKKLISKAKTQGFKTEMYFFCLNTSELAKERVEIRAKNNGHDVDEQTILLKWKEGYKNINLHFSDFDFLTFIDNSLDQEPTFLFELIKNHEDSFELTMFVEQLPDYTERRLPAIFDLMQNKD